MKINILFMAILFTTIISCTKNSENPTPANEQNITNENNKGNFAITVRKYTAAGQGASNAQVNIAASADSLANGLYIETKYTDSLGEVKFVDIDFGNNLSRTIYCNATYEYNGENFKGGHDAIIRNTPNNFRLIILQPYEVK